MKLQLKRSNQVTGLPGSEIALPPTVANTEFGEISVNYNEYDPALFCKLDNGDIITRDYLPININTKVGDTWNWIVARTPSLFLEAIAELEKDKNFDEKEEDEDKPDRVQI